jgi:hypothetical protein
MVHGWWNPIAGKGVRDGGSPGNGPVRASEGINQIVPCTSIATSAEQTIGFALLSFGDTIVASHRNETRRKNGDGMKDNPIRKISLIGFGEVGTIFGHDFTGAGLDVSVFDTLLTEEPSRSAMAAKAKVANVRVCDTLAEAVRGADLVISAVTASSAADAARSAAPFLRSGQIYLDLNSVSPDTKISIARAIGESPATFVEAAVMAPVSPQRLKAPMLLGGASAATVAARLGAIGMNVKAISDRP